MTREMLYVSDEGMPGTFEKDELAIPLPLPQLNDTLDRYYKSLQPFGTAEQLRESRRIIDEFRNGIGIRLQRILEERTKTFKNWVERWWEDYAYCTDRTPIFPYAIMTSTVMCDAIGLETIPEKALKVNNSLNIEGRSLMSNNSYFYFRLEFIPSGTSLP